MKLLPLILIFLTINFGALGIGTWLMDNGPTSPWYTNLNQAPWTPAGWVFGVAWSTIMVCFSVFMAYLVKQQSTQKVLLLFALQFILNVSWNYIFFNQHLVSVGLLVITLLTGVVTVFTFQFKSDMQKKTLLVLPYLIWLLIATSLNGYILLYN